MSLKQYFTSPSTIPLKDSTQNTNLKKNPTNNNILHQIAISTSSSKLIISNMESVISSVKKRKKEKKLRRKAIEPDISNISNILNSSLSFASPNTSAEERNNSDVIKEEKKKSTEIGKPKRSSRSSKDTTKENIQQKSESIKNQVSPKVQKVIPQDKDDPQPSTSTATTTPKKNAFEMLMNSRNKSIGSNSPGRDCIADASEPKTMIDSTKIKRKLLLEEWAERKGAAKRKLQEAQSEAYIQKEMDKRAKRLKKLVQNGAKTKKKPNEFKEDEEDHFEMIQIQTTRKKKKKEKNKNLDAEIDSKSKETKLKKKLNDNCKKTESVKEESNKIPKSNEKQVKVETVTTNKFPDNGHKTPQKQMKLTDILTPKSGTPSKRKILFSESKKTPSKSENIILNSPLKKRDSLLGYFNKLPKTPPEGGIESKFEEDASAEPSKTVVTSTLVATNNIDVLPSKKKSGRKPKPKTQPPEQGAPYPTREQTPPLLLHENAVASTSDCGRPKRTCRNKIISYDTDSDLSPAKIAAQKSLRRAKRLLSSPSPTKSSPKVLKTTKTSIASTSKLVTRKLAPIFVKALPKPMVDPEIALARQQFLMSGIPEKMKLEIERQRLFEEKYECDHDVFPSIGHVTQQISPQKMYPSHEVKLTYRGVEVCSPLKKFKHFKCGTRPLHVDAATTAEQRTKRNQLSIKNPKKLVRELKETNSDSRFLFYRCYKQLHNKFCKEDDDEAVEVNVVIAEDTNDASVEILSSTITVNNGNVPFTEKYKPTMSKEILVNLAPVVQLKKFLSSWLEQQQSGRYNRNYDSEDDFDLGNSSNSNSSVMNKAIVLIGPNGCGKTNAVYALANELNFKVLEINAGAKRTGKKILQELQEATQSHHVKGGSAGAGDKLFKCHSQSDECSSSILTPSSSQKLSLILIEDADVIFEQDYGFVDAIYQLIAISKRPVILIANQEHCLHLAKVKAANCVRFQMAKVENVSMWLSVLSIVEGCYIHHRDCAKLYVQNNKDFRRTLLEMQFFIQSGGDLFASLNSSSLSSQSTEYSHSTLCKLFSNGKIDGPLDFCEMNRNSKKSESSDNKKELSLEEILDVYNNLSFANRVQSSRNLDDKLVHNLNEEIASAIVDGVNGTSRINRMPLPETSFRTLLSTTIASQSSLRKRAINLDYEPCLRAICRSEKIRTQCERRGSRFYHYLRNSALNSFSTDQFDVHCTVLSNDSVT